MNETGSLPTTLQQVTVQTIAYTDSTCSPSISNWHVQFCAGKVGGGKGYYQMFLYFTILIVLIVIDTCQGDSGGPLMLFNASNQWVLVGLTSNGVGCARSTNMGVYTRVAYLQDWINSTMNSANRYKVSIYQLLFLFLPFLFF